ncbi:ankyrin repeat-containing domain protein [Coprinopsis sp. MPI-PUGE-AT-0042]|nr:ankyrin repeat-containing domain protein [Coprinopsis sp. MPI-PUGE-AT-0042]
MANHKDEPRTKLSRASFEGNLATVTRLLDSGVDYLEVDASGRTALHWAVAQHHLEVVGKLLAHHRRPISHPSTYHKFKRFASKILLGNPQPSSPTPTQIQTLTYDKLQQLALKVRPIITPIELAAQVNDEAIFKLLLENLEPFGDTALLFNGVWPPVPGAPGLCGRGSAYESVQNDQLPPKDPTNEASWWGEIRAFILRIAIKDGKLAVSDIVLRLGADPELGYTYKPLHVAASCQQDPAFIRLLLKYGANPNTESLYATETPLSLAIGAYNEEGVSALLEAGASPNSYGDPRYNSHLRKTCSLLEDPFTRSDPLFPLRILRALLKAGADVNAHPSLIHEVASRENGVLLFKELVAWGADIPTTDHRSQLVTRLAPRASWGSADEYRAVLDIFVAAYGSLSNLRLALLSQGPSNICYSVLLDFGLNMDCQPGIRAFKDALADCINDLMPGQLGVLMESAHVVKHLSFNHNGWLNQLFTTLSRNKAQITDETVTSIVGILRVLDHSGNMDPKKATKILFMIVQEFKAFVGEIEGVVDALMDMGASLYHPCISWVPGGSVHHFHDILALSAIYGHEQILSCLLRRLQSRAEGRETTFLIWPSWFQEDHFHAARLAHGSNLDAVLALLDSANHLLKADVSEAEHPLSVAIKRRDAGAVQKLVAFGLDVNHQDRLGWTLLHTAIEEGCSDIVNILLRANASESINIQARPLSVGPLISSTWDMYYVSSKLKVWCVSPLHLAAFKGNPSIVQSLLEHGADLHATTDVQPVPGSSRRPATALDFALCTLGYKKYRMSIPEGLYSDRLAIAAMLVERGARTSKDIMEQWMEMKLDEVLEKFSRHQALWDMFVAGELYNHEE